jgi:hypothetical protein
MCMSARSKNAMLAVVSLSLFTTMDFLDEGVPSRTNCHHSQVDRCHRTVRGRYFVRHGTTFVGWQWEVAWGAYSTE